MEKKHAFEDLLASKFAQQEHAPSSEAWSRIEQALKEKRSKVFVASPVQATSRSARMARILSVAAIFIGLIAATFGILRPSFAPALKESDQEVVQTPLKIPSLDQEAETQEVWQPKTVASEPPPAHEGFAQIISDSSEPVYELHEVSAPSEPLLEISETDPPVKKLEISTVDLEVKSLLAERVYFAKLDTQQRIDSAVLSSMSGADLLLEVEDELNQSFRAKVVQEIKQNIVKVSQAMAARNQ